MNSDLKLCLLGFFTNYTEASNWRAFCSDNLEQSQRLLTDCEQELRRLSPVKHMLDESLLGRAQELLRLVVRHGTVAQQSKIIAIGAFAAAATSALLGSVQSLPTLASLAVGCLSLGLYGDNYLALSNHKQRMDLLAVCLLRDIQPAVAPLYPDLQ